jgi:hypothetical protein
MKSQTGWLDVLERLARKNGVSITGSNGDEQTVLMVMACLAFDRSLIYSERVVNERLVAWLGNVGGLIRTDHVELRRTLVDFGLLCRQDGGRTYWRNECPAERFSAAFEWAADRNVHAELAAARAAVQSERLLRKAAKAI